jgi:hypothetical protein
VKDRTLRIRCSPDTHKKFRKIASSFDNYEQALNALMDLYIKKESEEGFVVIECYPEDKAVWNLAKRRYSERGVSERELFRRLLSFIRW